MPHSPAALSPHRGADPTASFGAILGCGASVLVTLAAVSLGATRHPLWELLPLALTCAAVGMRGSAVAAVLTAAVCWGCDSGFVLGRSGRLLFDHASAWSALALAVATLTGGALRGMHRLVVARYPLR